MKKQTPAPSLRTLADLGPLRRHLAERAERRRLEDEQARRERDRLAREQALFAASVGPVHPLKDPGRRELDRPRPAPVARQRVLDEEAALREALSDEFDVESLLETDEGLSWRRPQVGPEVLKRLRRGDWAIQSQVDLHGLRREEARERLSAFVREALRRGHRCVRVVHGKGLGSPGREPVLKGKVRSWLVQKQEVVAFTQARAAEGGAGALVVLLEDCSR
ncbi:Smr/MutS family protein [Aquabacterium sp. J223]|uniref:Smr/MutS family protein n=1 Tax=Aquabacterium sp. J223 TaxID=2898431 RepID=UPI0021ADA90D|nr:Smr/MutS family protein [Aquabacterium sp. J223]UUX95262.1 Smr/MutS family protein [Aquabacterium sp. J223]